MYCLCIPSSHHTKTAWVTHLCTLLGYVLFLCQAQLSSLSHHNNNNNDNGNFYSALPIKNFTAQGTYNSDTNNNNITQTHTQTHTHAHTHTHSHTHHHLRNTCHQNTHTKRLKIKPLALHLHSLSLSLPTCSYTGASHMQFYRRKSRVGSWTHREVLRVCSKRNHVLFLCQAQLSLLSHHVLFLCQAQLSMLSHHVLILCKAQLSCTDYVNHRVTM